jgi:hypothetical protein
MALQGKKTYITAVMLALASFATAMGWLSQAQYQVILGLLGSLGLAALRSGVDKGASEGIAPGGQAGPATAPPGTAQLPGVPSAGPSQG